MSIPMSETVGSLQRLAIQQDEFRNHPNQVQDESTARNIQDAVVHMFLPKKTPTFSPPNLEDTEEFLLQTFCASLSDAIAEVPLPELEPVQVMFEKWVKTQPKVFSDIQPINNFQYEISALQTGQSLPIYIRKQNSTLFITKQSNDGVFKIATFRSSLPSETVMSIVNSLSLQFPETEDSIHNSEMLKSRTFAMHLHELAVGDVDIALKRTTTSAGDECKVTREVVDPYLVSDWIVGLLVPGSNSSESQSTAVSIEKKIRDQVNLSSGRGSSFKLPFRRSGMYMSLKASLQLKLLEVLGSVHHAKLVYKIILLRILSDITKQYCDLNETIDMDLASQMLSKLGVRAMKLDDPIWDTPDNSNEKAWITITILKSKCLEYTKAVAQHLQDQLQTLWKSVAEPERKDKDCTEPAKNNDMDKDSLQKNLLHHLPLVDEFIQKLKTSESTHPAATPKEHIISVADSQSFSRYPTIESIEEADVSSSSSNIWLHDTENLIKYECDDIEASWISELVTLYVKKASYFGRENPIRMSQMFLVCLKVLELIDRIATKEHPLLLEYSPAFDSELFDSLLLPHQSDMDLLEDLLDYFEERQKRAQYSGVLDNASVKWDTFSVRFALQDQEMVSLRNRILMETEEGVQKKYDQINLVREECLNLQSQINAPGSICSCEEGWDWILNKPKRVKTCDLHMLKSQLNYLRKSVSIYERPPPPDQHCQLALAFEILIPEILSVWRDFMAFFKHQILGEPVFSDGKDDVRIKWREYSGLASFDITYNSTKVCLGSTVMPSSYTHLTKTQRVDVLSNRNEDFIRNSGMNCTFDYQDRRPQTKCVRTACTFQLKGASGYIPYENLQNAVESTTHTQNAILSTQYACHPKLQLPEFVAFGSLRAGHRIQLRNLYESIFSGRLSLHQEPVLALILQTIWQMGPKNEDSERESHTGRKVAVSWYPS